MPVRLSADSAGRFAIVTVIDPYDIDEWRAVLRALLRQRVFRARRAVLIDRRDCAPPDAAFVTQMSEFFAAHKKALAGAVGAIVVSGDVPSGMGPTTGLQSSMENPDVATRIFRSYDEGARWLGGRPSSPNPE
jgi:hypothetical protein